MLMIRTYIQTIIAYGTEGYFYAYTSFYEIHIRLSNVQPQRLLSGSEVGGVNGNSGLGYGGGGSEDARARGFVDDEWED